MTFIGDSPGFWLVAICLAAGVAGLLILSLLAARGRSGEAPALAHDVALYRDQIAGIERDEARGTLAPSEAKRLKTEVARRLLEADRRAARTGGGERPARGALILPALAILAAVGGGIGIYLRLGQPGLPDLPLASRIAEADARIAGRQSQAGFVASLPPVPAMPVEPEFAALMDKLRAAVDPAVSQDLTGLALLARNEAALGNFGPARAAQERLIAVKGPTDAAADHVFLAEILIREAGAYVSPEAEAALRAALAIEPQNGAALYYYGLMFAQGGRFDRAFALWQPLMNRTAPDAPWAAILREQIAEVAMLAGVDYQPPPAPALPGPDAAALAAAADLAPEDRAAMVEGMVAQLSQRLATEGGPAEEWARLIRSLGVLGREAEAREILAEARSRFTAAEDLALIGAAATDAGLAE
ncbi:c-type cytochrome biogenesis protein CcmI [Pseudogemmobacter humi]|uniref:Cytochrome c-type biogenesis protein CcmH n=1 Tax=Pseudogemmobacter humi TaxID=2483812 RepID=A0A3P5XI47_9RHOB|nr:c-type cytochrome biogenesis protein CcmI [Pseudogemmobacter humi]VDC30574.1 hypothetical protein XINFAN_02596 [Pseudogemmobacter humi]